MKVFVNHTDEAFRRIPLGELLEGKPHDQFLRGGAGNGPNWVPRQPFTRQITFRELNQRFGAKDYMVRNKNSVPRFMNLCLLAYTLVEVLSLGVTGASQTLFHAVCDRPWYHRNAPSIGQMRNMIQLLASRALGIFNAKVNSRLEAKNPGTFYRRLAAQRQFPYFSKVSTESLN